MICPRCGGRLFYEQEVDGTPYFYCISGHSFYPFKPLPMIYQIPHYNSAERQEKVKEMIRLRNEGWKVRELLKAFHVSHETFKRALEGVS